MRKKSNDVIIGIRGMAGCGKTTIANLIVGALEDAGLLVNNLDKDDTYAGATKSELQMYEARRRKSIRDSKVKITIETKKAGS